MNLVIPALLIALAMFTMLAVTWRDGLTGPWDYTVLFLFSFIISFALVWGQT